MISAEETLTGRSDLIGYMKSFSSVRSAHIASNNHVVLLPNKWEGSTNSLNVHVSQACTALILAEQESDAFEEQCKTKTAKNRPLPGVSINNVPDQ